MGGHERPEESRVEKSYFALTTRELENHGQLFVVCNDDDKECSKVL